MQSKVVASLGVVLIVLGLVALAVQAWMPHAADRGQRVRVRNSPPATSPPTSIWRTWTAIRCRFVLRGKVVFPRRMGHLVRSLPRGNALDGVAV